MNSVSALALSPLMPIAAKAGDGGTVFSDEEIAKLMELIVRRRLIRSVECADTARQNPLYPGDPFFGVFGG